MLINRLISHALGEVEMTQTQVRAVEILLRKTLPDLSAVENTGEIKHTYVARMPSRAASTDEWKRLYNPTIPESNQTVQ
jgi:hypothetical protein